MPNDNRRHEDARMVRLEDRLCELYSKVTNGITDRGIRTEEIVVELRKKQSIFETKFAEHLVREEVEQHNMCIAIEGINVALGKLATAQAGIAKSKQIAIYGAMAALTSTVAWLFANSDKISAFTQLIGNV